MSSSSKLNVVMALTESPASKHALEWACKHFLNPTMHKVTLLTVVEPPIQAGYYYAASAAMYSPSFIDEVYRKATEDATQTVRQLQKDLEAHFNGQMECQMVVGKGEVRDEIVDYVEAVKADLLIVGSRGLGALKR